ncbi:hypothetical protein KY290_000427 [Solanum tuberosum]|uniref:Uncharacterized protein n=1 Tax=Solanum tuberosum TaxID=4113 RepID=A0ABQ7WJB0_SOLTU|nr:hypothetical protein KY284_000475 [Solanum tuberosum]KAH0729280.1 hypothetical protein KY289_000468 [Solanum tuberosum]KAH0780829.1 hypothetical protein KY290_000427 [Solanum tuberosum]
MACWLHVLLGDSTKISDDFKVFDNIYDSDLHFTVQVFDESSCEKEASYNADCTQGATDMYNLALKKRDRGNSVILDCIVEGIPKKMRRCEIPSECTSSQDTHGLASSKDGYTPEDAVCSYARRK